LTERVDFVDGYASAAAGKPEFCRNNTKPISCSSAFGYLFTKLPNHDGCALINTIYHFSLNYFCKYLILKMLFIAIPISNSLEAA